MPPRCAARLARAEGVARLAHVSGLGVDPGSASPYVRARWHGEKVVLMEHDNVAPGEHPGFAKLGIEPRGVLEWLSDHASSRTARRVA